MTVYLQKCNCLITYCIDNINVHKFMSLWKCDFNKSTKNWCLLKLMKQQYRKNCKKYLIKNHVKAALTLLFQTGTLLVLSALYPAEPHCPKTWKVLKLRKFFHNLMAKSTLCTDFLWKINIVKQFFEHVHKCWKRFDKTSWKESSGI